MRTRPRLGAAASAALILSFGGSVFAGEYAPGNGETPIKTRHVAQSNCAFSGADESDDTEDHGDHPGDDADWALTPAGGKAQSPGQIVATNGSEAAGIPGSTDYPYDTCRGYPTYPSD